MPASVPPATGAPPPPQSSGLVVPDETAKKFPDIIALIKGSESMNEEERQYWVNILPIMTPDQLQSLRDILDNERKQLQAIDDKYTKAAPSPVGQGASIQRVEEERRKKRTDRQSAESSHMQQEAQEAESLLRQIETQ